MRLPRTPVLTALLVLTMLAPAACGDDDGQAQGPGTTTDDPIPWGTDLVSTDVVVDGDPEGLVPATLVRITFHADGRVIAAAGCNTIGIDEASVVDGRLHASAGSMTEMGCEPARHRQDEWLADLLSDRPEWDWDGETLVLTRGDDQLTLVDRELADPDRPIEGTNWVLDTLIAGESASDVPGPVTATLRMGRGSLSGSTGCNEFDGTVEIDEDELRIDDVVTTEVDCEGDAAEVEEHILEVLDGTVTWEIEAARLWLTAPDGQGLGFVAAD